MAIEGIDKFKASISGVHPASLFTTQITLPQTLGEWNNHGETLRLTTEEVVMPGRSLTTTDIGGNYYPGYAIPYGYKNNELSLTFMLTGGYETRTIFELWLDLICDHRSFLMRYPKEYVGTLNISQLDAQHKSIHEVVCDQAYPKAIEDITFSASSADYVKLQIPFVYRHMYVKQTVGARRGDSIKTVTGDNNRPGRGQRSSN